MALKPGATGKFPHGMLDDTDEGELLIRISGDGNGRVRIDFGKRVAWFALDSSEEVKQLCRLLLTRAGVTTFKL